MQTYLIYIFFLPFAANETEGKLSSIDVNIAMNSNAIPLEDW